MNRLISYAILTCFFSCLAYSQDCNLDPRDNEILVIGITGFGNNNSEALKDAKRNAITQAVGSYIQSETTINQSKLENDKIHEYGKGQCIEPSSDYIVPLGKARTVLKVMKI